MYAFGFSLIWLVCVTALTVATWMGAIDGGDAGTGWVLLGFVAVGLFAVWHSWRRLRRRRSLHIETEGGISVYVWIDLDGRERRSTTDPRQDWDAEDGDGDDGGD